MGGLVCGAAGGATITGGGVAVPPEWFVDVGTIPRIAAACVPADGVPDCSVEDEAVLVGVLPGAASRSSPAPKCRPRDAAEAWSARSDGWPARGFDSSI